MTVTDYPQSQVPLDEDTEVVISANRSTGVTLSVWRLHSHATVFLTSAQALEIAGHLERASGSSWPRVS